LQLFGGYIETHVKFQPIPLSLLMKHEQWSMHKHSTPL